MSKILLLEQEVSLGRNLEFFLEDAGHFIDWRHTPKQIKDAYDPVPNYDAAIVDIFCDERNPTFTCNKLVKKFKKIHSSEDVICLTNPLDPCKYADENLDIFQLLIRFGISTKI
jgi:DNA-binding NtrC family response regulator